MNRYLWTLLSAVILGLVGLPCQISATNITETTAAIGEGCVATGKNSISMGNHTSASGDYSTAMGNHSSAGHYSTAMGHATEASGSFSTAMGCATKATGKNSTAMGYDTEASGDYSTAMGEGTEAGGEHSFAGGKFMQLTSTAGHTFVWGATSILQPISTANAFLIFPVGTPGRVGIGTSEPVSKLDIHGEGGAILLARLNQIGGKNWCGWRYDRDGSEKWFIGMGNADEKLLFRRTASSNDMVIDETGRVGMGTTTPGQKLDISGGNGRVETGYNWLTNSDSRLKKNVSTLEGSLEKISRLRGVRFDIRKADSVENGSGKHIGVIAQELEKEYPELVVGDEKTGYKAVAYDKLTAVLIEAVKELKDQNKKQKAEIQELRLMIKELKS